jgi:phage shock protein C
MYCTKCGIELRSDDRFCSRCGNRIAAGTAPDAVPNMPRAPMLEKRNKKIAGVCAGFATYLGVDVVLVRVLWLGISLCTGVGFFVYLAAWIVVPSDAGIETCGVRTHLPQTT